MRLLLVGLLLPVLAFAQDREYLEIAARNLSSQVYYQADVLPAAEGKSALVVSFRVPNDRLVFTRNREAGAGGGFVSDVDFSIELFRDREQIDEQRWRTKYEVATYESSVSKAEDLEGSVTFIVEPGRYAFRIASTDPATQRTTRTPPRPVRVTPFDGLTVGAPLIADEVDGRQIGLTNLSGQTRFSGAGFAVVPIMLPEGVAPETATLSYVLREPDPELVAKEQRDRRRRMREERRRQARARDGEERWNEERMPGDLDGGDVVTRGTSEGPTWIGVAAFEPAQAEAGVLTLAEGENAYLAVIDFEGETLDNGTYVLDFDIEVQGAEDEDNADGASMADAGTDQTSRSARVPTHWRNMPLSLFDLDVALDNMRFILQRDELSELKEGDSRQELASFRAFWSERDPTPETAYNELMAEYYRRVDHAAFEFRSNGSPLPDGLRTDRAKIYIVHGPPEDIERDLPTAGGVRETWTYGDGRTYIFAAESALTPFRLVKSG
ncbi:MAG: GWxTD domain-containing protein [Bacteroidota bacterium]